MSRRRTLSLALASAVAVTGATSVAVAGAARPDHVVRTGAASSSPVADLLRGSYHADYQRLSGSTKPQIKNRKAPRIVGRPQVGETLGANGGTWNPAEVRLSYQWFVGTHRIPGAQGQTLKVKPALADAKVTVVVTAKKKGYRTATAVAKPVRMKQGVIEVLDDASISGRLKVGRTLVLDPGTYDVRGVQLDYQWFRDGKPVAGATGTTYKLKQADRGRRISALVVVSKAGYRQTSSSASTRGKVS